MSKPRDLRDAPPSPPAPPPETPAPPSHPEPEPRIERAAPEPSASSPANAASALAIDGRFRLRFLPILAVVGMAFLLLLVPGLVVDWLSDIVRLPVHESNLRFLYADHAVQLVLALVLIAIVRRFVPADYGLHMPPGRSYVGTAIIIGFFFGLLMTVVDYAPQILTRTAPQLDYHLNTSNVTGWLFFEGVYVGPTEEIPFRGLLVTFLAATMPGRVRFGRFEMNGAGVVVAVLFALAHIGNFVARPFFEALGQQAYAFALGICYAYWLEKSRSILAPIIGHNVGDLVEYALLFTMVAAWSA